MSNTALATTRPEDQAKEKSRLLQEALLRISELGLELDIATGIEKILIHIVHDYAFDRMDVQTQAKAQGIAIVTINLGLEYATKGDVDKAVAALTKNPVEKIFLIGKKLSDELLTRVRTTWEQAAIESNATLLRGAYGITDKATEAQLVRWIEHGVSDHPFLPIGTMAEYNAVKSVLDRVERETVLAQKVQWSEVFADADSRFTADIFRRGAKLTPNPLGGIWKPFLLSLITQAMTGGWTRNQRRLAFVDREAIVEFVELVTFEFRKLHERAGLAAERLAEIAMQTGVFKTACSRAEIEEMFGFAQAWMEELSTEAKTFCFAAEDLDAVTDIEVDRFWRTRLFLSSHVPYNVRMAESSEPWKQLPKATTFAALRRVLKDFPHWPESERERMLETFKLDPLLDAITGVDKQAEELYALPITTELATRTITWTHRSKLLMALRRHAEHGRFHETVQAIATCVQWDYDQIVPLFGTTERDFIGSAIRSCTPPLSQEQWEDACRRATADHGTSVEEVWSAMDDAQQEALFMHFTARAVSAAMNKWPIARVETFFRKVIGEMHSDRPRTLAFERWFKGGTNGMHFIEWDAWIEPLEKLFKELLGWKTRKELRAETLPTGHPDRRHLDLAANRERVAAILADRPWERVANASSFDELTLLLTNFVLWPYEQQDNLCFSGHRFDAFIDVLPNVGAQADAMGSLRKAMKSPFEESGVTDTVLYKLFRWDHRAELIAALGRRGRIRSPSLLRIAQEVVWPAQAVALIENDAQLFAIAFLRMARPTSQEEWEAAHRIASGSNLGVARKVWEWMDEPQRQTTFMRFPPSYVSEFFLERPWEEVQALFLPILEERGADPEFQKAFKRWFTDQYNKHPRRFLLKEDWREPFWKLVGEKLNWARSVNPPHVPLEKKKQQKENKVLEELAKTDPPPTQREWEAATEKHWQYHGDFGRRLWRIMPQEVRETLFLKVVGRAVSAELEGSPWEQVRAFFEPILTVKAKDGNFKRRFALWYYGDGTSFGTHNAFQAPKAWKREMEDLLREYDIHKPRPRGP